MRPPADRVHEIPGVRGVPVQARGEMLARVEADGLRHEQHLVVTPPGPLRRAAMLRAPAGRSRIDVHLLTPCQGPGGCSPPASSLSHDLPLLVHITPRATHPFQSQGWLDTTFAKAVGVATLAPELVIAGAGPNGSHRGHRRRNLVPVGRAASIALGRRAGHWPSGRPSARPWPSRARAGRPARHSTTDRPRGG